MKIVIIVCFALFCIAAFFWLVVFKIKSGYMIENKEVVYYDWNEAVGSTRVVLKADFDSFKILDDDYAIDNEKVFFLDRIIEGARPQNFQRIKIPDRSRAEDIYSRDEKNVFVGTTIFSGVDPATFQVLGDGFTKDKFKVYFGKNQILEADAETFEILKQNYAKDYKNVYFKEQKLQDANPAKLRFLEDYTMTILLDDKNVFYFESRLVDADPNTFKIVNPRAGGDDPAFADKNNKYNWRGEKLR